MSPKNVYLIGFMGAGKSTVAPLLAEKLGVSWVDTDSLIEERTGLSVPEIFNYYGESRFRDIERRVVLEVCQKPSRVVAVGGGAPMDDQNWQSMAATGVMIYLELGPKEIHSRVSADGSRPLLEGLSKEEKMEKIHKILSRRHPRYKEAEQVVNCNGATRNQVVEEIAKKLDGFYEEG